MIENISSTRYYESQSRDDGLTEEESSNSMYKKSFELQHDFQMFTY